MTMKIRHSIRSTIAFALIGSIGFFALACGASANVSPAMPGPLPQSQPVRAITLGDIDASEPVKKIKRFQPLARYLASHLKEFGIAEGDVVIARDIEEMAGFLRDGIVDIDFDSSFPTLAVQELSGSQVIARRWKQADPTDWSTYITLKGSGITSVDDFVGKVLAFEDPYSTSGFLLPAGTLVQQGFTLREVSRPDANVAPGEIGYYFALDEENTVELLLRGLVAGGGFSNQDYQELPEELIDQITAIGQTIAVPRQLVSARPGLDPQVVGKVRESLIGLDQTDEGLAILDKLKKTKKFDALPQDSAESLDDLKGLIKLVSR